MRRKFYGKQRENILQRLVEEWLPGSMPVAILQGFPGCGKSQLALDVAEATKSSRSLARVEPPLAPDDQVQYLFLELATELEQNGSTRLANEFDKGTDANFSKALIDTLRYEQVLIIVDEFQRLFPKKTTTPHDPWQTIVEKLGNSPNPKGRLLLISNRAIKIERWCDNCLIEEVESLAEPEAEAMLTELLESSGLLENVPVERRGEIARRLGGNPRALKTLVGCLRIDPLDDLLSAAPDSTKSGDVALNPQLVEDFERELLERALPKMETDLLKFMRWLSVHRRPFRKEALAKFTGGGETTDTLRKQLFDRFLLEQTNIGDVTHPLAREICITRLRSYQEEWAQAHNLAADYYFQYFKASQLTKESALSASYVELRHHLYEAGRIAEIGEASEKLTKFALSRIGLTTPIPNNKELLEERIALLTSIPDEQRPKVLNYHLARCLKKRGAAGDDKRALKYARGATKSQVFSAVWLFRLDLEYKLNGISTAIRVLNDALKNVRPENGAELYVCGAEMMCKADRMHDAIKLLKKGIEVIPADKNLYSLYQSCAEIMAKADRMDDAIELLKKGIEVIPADKSLVSLYQSCADIMSRAGRMHDAIKLLEKGIEVIPADKGLFSLYQSCAEIMAKADRMDDAIELLEKGIEVIPADKNLFSLYQSCAEIMVRANRKDDAMKLLEKGFEVIPADKSLYILYQCAIQIAGDTGDTTKVLAFTEKGLSICSKENFRGHKIIETGLRILATMRDSKSLQRLQGLINESAQLKPQSALADFYLMRFSGDWKKAAEIVHKARAVFPNYLLLRIHETDARLALGQRKEAVDLMRDYTAGSGQTRNNPAIWLKSYILGFIAGDMDEARSLAAMYAPLDFDPARELDETELMRLWSVTGNYKIELIEMNFPGLFEFRLQNATLEDVAETLTTSPQKQLCVLAIATEWASRHGGLSTFNRDLCAALAAAGARVVCYVPQADADEIIQANKGRVEIVVAKKMTGQKDVSLLVQRPDLPAGFVPDVVIGHDRITGPASVVLVRDHFSNAKRVLFIHTLPEEIEWYKENYGDSTCSERAAERKQEQLSLAEGCDLVVAVGPHLTKEFGTDLHGVDNKVPIMEITPGMSKNTDSGVATLPSAIRCLVLGRVEDYELKGLDLAAKALGRVAANWKDGSRPKLVVRGAPRGTDAALRERIKKDSAPAELDIVIRNYSADETEIRSDLREASLVLMPSKKEGFGLVGLEAIDCGVPTLISSESGLSETLRCHAPSLAEDWILPVTEDAVTKWSERIGMCLKGREGAFSRIATLREELSGKLSWHRSATEVLDKLFPSRAS